MRMERRPTKYPATSRLSDDLLEHCILPRLPAKSLIRFQSVSKKWHRLISSRHPNFIRMQSHHAACGLVGGFNRTYLSKHPASVGIPTFSADVEKFGGKMASVAASCNGLLCIETYHNNIIPRLVIGNPSLNDWKQLPSHPWHIGVYGLTVDSTTMNYNLVLFRHIATQYEFHIYSSATGQWRVVKEKFTLSAAGTKLAGRVCVCVKGSTLYWKLDNGRAIMWFRPQEELCGLLALPPAAGALDHGSIGECDGKLCYAMITGEKIQMWSMVDHSQCWSKRLSVTLGGSVGMKLKGSCHNMQLKRREQSRDNTPHVVFMPFEGGDSLSFYMDGIMYCYDTLTAAYFQ